MTIVIATSARAAMDFAKRTDMPTDLGEPKEPSRYLPGARRWGFSASPTPASIIERIQKLLALAERGGTEHEAVAAASAAQKLMATYQLTEALLSVQEESKKDEPAVHSRMDSLGKRKTIWKGILASHLARANGCYMYWQNKTEIKIVGPETLSNTVRQLYLWLVAEIDLLAAKEASGRGRTYAHTWRLGCATRIGQRVEEAAKLSHQEAVEEAKALVTREPGTGLVRINAALAKIEDDRAKVLAITKKMSFAKKEVRSVYRDISGYEAGLSAGERVKLTGAASLGGGL